MDYKKYEDILHEFDRAIVYNTKNRMMRFSISCSLMRVMLAEAKEAIEYHRARTSEAIDGIARARQDAHAYREQVVHERQTILALREQLKSAERKASIWKTKCENLKGTK